MDAMDDAAFPSFLCPIGREIMRDPVNCADGHSYERASIERWLATNNTSPRTGAQLPNKVLIPNHALRSSIEEWHSTPAAKVLHEATDAATQIVNAAQADASRMRGEAAKEVATFLKASLSSPEQQSLCAESTRQAEAIVKAARDQPRSGKMRLKAVADARRRRRESVLQWHRKKAVAGSGGGGGSAAAMSLSTAAPAPTASNTGPSFTFTPSSTPHSGVCVRSSKGLDSTDKCTDKLCTDNPFAIGAPPAICAALAGRPLQKLPYRPYYKARRPTWSALSASASSDELRHRAPH